MKKIIFSILSVAVAFAVSVTAYSYGESALENDPDIGVEENNTTAGDVEAEETTTIEAEAETSSESEETTSEPEEETTTEETTTTTKAPDVILETDPPKTTDPDEETTTTTEEEIETTTEEITTSDDENATTAEDTAASEPEETTDSKAPVVPGEISVDTNAVPQAPEGSPEQNFTATIVIIALVFVGLILSFVLPPVIKFIRNKIIYKYD